MVDKQKLIAQLKKLKKQIQEDPQVRAIYDLDGDGNISGEEWDKARQSVIRFMKATESSVSRSSAAGKAAGAAGMAVAGAAGAADHVFNEIKSGLKNTGTQGAPTLFTAEKVIVRQLVERLELMTDFEGRNKYKFLTEKGQQLAHAEEEARGAAGFITRSLLTSRRPFSMGISVHGTPAVIWLKRRFEWIFSYISVSDDETPIGSVQQKFGLLNRKYELDSHLLNDSLSVTGPLFKPWTFHVTRNERPVAAIRKKWSGLLKEAVTRADNFEVTFSDPKLGTVEKKLIFAAAIAIDIDYFEQRQK